MINFTYNIRLLYTIVFVGWLITRVFRAVKYKNIDFWREFLLAGLLFYAGFLLYQTFEPFTILLERHDQRVNLVPLQGILRMIENASIFDDDVTQRIVFINLAGNILLFSPFGMIMPLLDKRLKRWWLVVLVGFGFSLVIELAQTFLIARVFDVDDLLLNGFGTLLGYLAFAMFNLLRPFREFFNRIRDAARPNSLRYALLFFVFVLAATIGVYRHGLDLYYQIPQ